MSEYDGFDTQVDGVPSWREILNSITGKATSNNLSTLKIRMSKQVELRIRSSMHMGGISSLSTYMRMCIVLMEKAVEAKNRGARVVIQEKNGNLTEIIV